MAVATGMNSSVRTVLTVSPAMMVTAMGLKRMSHSRGIMPRTVVKADMDTGRRRLTPFSTMVS